MNKPKTVKNITDKELKTLTGDDAEAIANSVLDDMSKTISGTHLKDVDFNKFKAMYDNENRISANNGKAFFQPFIGVLLEKVLLATLSELPDLNYLSFIDMFRGKDITQGSAIEFQAQQIGGYVTYSRDAWVPEKAEYKNVLSQVVSLSSPNFQKIKIPLTININEFQYYMMSKEALASFLNEQRESLSKTHTLLVFNNVMRIITSTTYANTIVGTASNMFDSIIEVTSKISEMPQLSGEFNLINQVTVDANGTVTQAPEKNFITTSKLSDLIWIWSLDNENKATMGVKSQVFNQQLWGSPITSQMKMVALKNRYDISSTDASMIPTKNATDWINNNTIYIINKDAFQINYQLNNVVTSQQYAENMLMQININSWFLVSPIHFGQAFKYTNPNLGVVPKIIK